MRFGHRCDGVKAVAQRRAGVVKAARSAMRVWGRIALRFAAATALAAVIGYKRVPEHANQPAAALNAAAKDAGLPASVFTDAS